MTQAQGMTTHGLFTLLVATTNPGKMGEYRAMLADLPLRLLSLADVGLAGFEVAETGETYLENALLKADQYAARAGLPTLADDSGVAVDALGGRPGVYSARYAPSPAEAIHKLLGELAGVPAEGRRARFICVTAIITPDGLTAYAEGRVEGQIAFEVRGGFGFGYDPVFCLPDGRMMAEVPQPEKNRISHRGIALARLTPVLRGLSAR
jgi:XTP/dITP diphosphohydrolase